MFQMTLVLNGPVDVGIYAYKVRKQLILELHIVSAIRAKDGI